ncbi:MAG TPA: deoxynucleoside kinase [Flavipsychrobacter sp.]|nr:deoxynucleoside kinase [Flavipsychrobacter sp.]
MNYRYIAIEGNIGAGKSTLANLLAKHYDARLILEEFADNNFLPKFYNEPERYAFPLELSFLADRYKQLKQILLHQDLFQQKIVSDYLFTKSKLFAKINLKDDEYELFQKLFDIIDIQLPQPDLLIYLHCPIGKLQKNIQRRGRSYEQKIADEYLEKVQDVYQQYLKQNLHKTLTIDVNTTDFITKPQHFHNLLSFLEKDYDFQTHYLSVE